MVHILPKHKRSNSRPESDFRFKFLPDSKRSQITPFIIIAIVIVSFLLLYFIIKSNLSVSGINPNVKEVYNYVQECIEKVGNDALFHIGDTGGYFFVPNLSTENERAYYFYENNNYMPSKESIEEELSTYMNEMLFFCTINFVDLKNYEISQGKIKTDTVIEDEKVVFSVSYPLSIRKGESSYTLENFYFEVPVRLGTIHNFIDEIMKIQLETPYDICVSCIGDLGIEYELQVSLQDYQENDVIFVIIDPFSEINGEPYRFYFVNKYENEKV